MMKEKSEKISFLYQVDLYKEMMSNGEINKKYFLQDGLHLNQEGYVVLNRLLNEELKTIKTIL